MASTHAALIDSLARDLRPLARLPALWKRLSLWLATIAWLGLLLSFFSDFDALQHRLIAAPDMWISLASAALTAVLACLAALQISIPGRSGKWALLPVPALAVWLGASAAGCLRLSAITGVKAEPAMHSLACLRFVVLVSVPLSLLLGWQLLKAYPLRPALTASLGGLASAAAAAVLLALIHPYDANYEDLGVHFIAVICVVIVARLWGGRALGDSLHLSPSRSQAYSQRLR